MGDTHGAQQLLVLLCDSGSVRMPLELLQHLWMREAHMHFFEDMLWQ